MYSMRNKGKSIAAEKFLKTLKKKTLGIWHQYQKMSILIN